jgi:hypothetical protein
MERAATPVPVRFKLEEAPRWLQSWWKIWIWSRSTPIQGLVRSPIFKIERRELFEPVSD